MEPFDFINSKDIREHLRMIDYPFSPLEAAWLIWQCRNATIGEKHRAWSELIETMPDCAIPERPWTKPQKSLQMFLKQYMGVENRLVSEFQEQGVEAEKRYVWVLSRRYETGEIRDSGLVFSSFKALCTHEKDVLEDVVSLHCRRVPLDAENSWDESIEAELARDLSFRKIACRPLKNREDDEVFNGVFDGLWFMFPTPFARGDLLWFPERGKRGLHSGPFVNDGTIYEVAESEVLQWLIRNGDNSDMISYGWQLSGGIVLRDHLDCYMNAEYYPNTSQMEGRERVLQTLSDYLKGRISSDEWYAENKKLEEERFQFSRANQCEHFLKSGIIGGGEQKKDK